MIVRWAAVVFATLAASLPVAAPASDGQYKTGETFKDCSECPEMVVVPAGSFMMGSPEDEAGRTYFEGPQHRVTFSQPFAIGKYAVTFDEWNACVADRGCDGYQPSDSSWSRVRKRCESFDMWNIAMSDTPHGFPSRPFALSISTGTREYILAVNSASARERKTGAVFVFGFIRAICSADSTNRRSGS